MNFIGKFIFSPMSSATRSSLVRDFLLRRGVDSDAADYAASIAEDDDLEVLREFIAEACPDAATSSALDDLLERCRSGAVDGKGEGTSPHPPAPQDPSVSTKDHHHLQVSPSALIRALELRSTKVEEEDEKEEDEDENARRRKSSNNDRSDDGDGEAAVPSSAVAAVDSLLELFPARGRDYLAHALRINGADVSDAAAWLSSSSSSSFAAVGISNGGDNNDDDNGESAWRAAREARRNRRAAERAADEAARTRLLEKFEAADVETSGESSSGRGRGGGAPVRLWGEEAGKKGGGGGKQQPQQRFRDGVAVTSKGEKYITIKEGEEWDGGSRGRVVLKGKRGAGGVKLAK